MLRILYELKQFKADVVDCWWQFSKLAKLGNIPTIWAVVELTVHVCSMQGISDLSPLVFIVISEFVFSEPHRHNIKKIVFDMVWWSSYHYMHYYCLAPYFVIAL